jgi:SprT protein
MLETPMVVRVVRHRETKHGDHTLVRDHGYSVITVSENGNRYLFAITLLHEIAHAQVTQRGRRRTAPHGAEWKAAFRMLLLEALPLFPEDLRWHIETHARAPLYSSDSDPTLALALRRYDTGDLRSTVAELAPGQMFSLNGKRILIKGELLRKWYRCTTPQGKVFRVSPAARVHTLYEA